MNGVNVYIQRWANPVIELFLLRIIRIMARAGAGQTIALATE